MSTQGYRDNRFPFVLTGHLVMAGRGLWTPRQLLLSMSTHACNRVTLFCEERRKTDEDHEETHHLNKTKQSSTGFSLNSMSDISKL